MYTVGDYRFCGITPGTGEYVIIIIAHHPRDTHYELYDCHGGKVNSLITTTLASEGAVRKSAYPSHCTEYEQINTSNIIVVYVAVVVSMSHKYVIYFARTIKTPSISIETANNSILIAFSVYDFGFNH
jgi:hypothetical protein